MLRDQGLADPAALRVIGLQGLFIGGWPLPVLDLVRGTVAHTLLLAALNLQANEFPHRWDAREVDLLCSELAALMDESSRKRFSLPDEGQHAPPVSIVPTPGTGDVSGDRRNVAFYLAACIDEQGDRDFVRSVVDAVAEKELQADLAGSINDLRIGSGWGEEIVLLEGDSNTE